MDASRSPIRVGSPRSREIGPIGTAGRIASGALLIAVPIVRDDSLRAWDLAASVTVLPLLAAVVAALTRAVFRRRASSAPSLVTIGLVLGIATALTYVTPANEPAIWLFLGISMLVAAARGQSGCEVLALPNALRGGEDRLDCLLFGPVDAAEARRSAGARQAPG